MLSRGGVHGGLTIADAIHEFESKGYLAHFVVREGAAVKCTECGARLRPSDVPLEAMRRTEGASDPADMVFVGALRCPACGAQGTAVLSYGPTASPEEAEVLRELENRRLSTLLSQRAGDDRSLVSDTGWLSGPDG